MARQVARRRPVAVLDGDRTGHAVLHEPAVKEQIRHHFGPAVFDERGEVDRGALARRVFGPSDEQRQVRHALEQIVHPRIREKLIAQIDQARSDPQCEAVLLDAAVLFEAGWNDLCNAVVFVETPEALRTQRVQQTRGWTAGQLAAREASQRDVAWKRRAADHAIVNDQTLDHAAAQLERILDQLLTNRPAAPPPADEQIHAP